MECILFSIRNFADQGKGISLSKIVCGTENIYNLKDDIRSSLDPVKRIPEDDRALAAWNALGDVFNRTVPVDIAMIGVEHRLVGDGDISELWTEIRARSLPSTGISGLSGFVGRSDARGILDVITNLP